MRSLGICCTALGVMFSISAVSQAAPITFSAAGADAAAIQASVDAFRSALGTLNANVAGSFGTGRREINWDGVPNNLAAPNNLPANFFNVNSPRGVVFSTAGTGFQVSANSGVAAIEFDTINAGYSNSFSTFSPQRLFTALGSNVTDVSFFVPGSTQASFTSAFGAVFTDVDLANTTGIQFFDVNNNSLGTFFALAANNGLSFLGVRFNGGEQIGRVRLISGNAALGAGVSDAPGTDLVVMDDFLYAEPAQVPEPATWTLMAAGAAFAMLMRRRSGSSRVK